MTGLEVEVAGIDGATTDDPLDTLVLDGAEFFNVGDARQTTRGDDGYGQGLSQFDRGVDIDAREHAVASNVGVDDGLNPVVLKLARQVNDFVAGEFAPTVGGDFAVFGVKADDDVAAKGAAGVFEKARVFDGGGADDHITNAAVDVSFNGVEVTDAAAELHGDVVAHRFEYGFDGAVILGLASKGAVEVDQMQTTRPFVDPVQGHVGGVFTEGGRLVHVALFEAHTLSVFQVDGWDQKHKREWARFKGAGKGLNSGVPG